MNKNFHSPKLNSKMNFVFFFFFFLESKSSVPLFMYYFMFHQSLLTMRMIAFYFKLQLFYKESKMKACQVVIDGI